MQQNTIDLSNDKKWQDWKSCHLDFYNLKEKEVLNDIRSKLVNIDYDKFIEWIRLRFGKMYEIEFYKRVYKNRSVISYLHFYNDFIKYSRRSK